MCVCVIALLKAKMFKAFATIFQIIFWDRSKLGLNITLFSSKLLVSHLLMSFAIVVIINKALKLFQLVLVVYCDSC